MAFGVAAASSFSLTKGPPELSIFDFEGRIKEAGSRRSQSTNGKERQYDEIRLSINNQMSILGIRSRHVMQFDIYSGPIARMC